MRFPSHRGIRATAALAVSLLAAAAPATSAARGTGTPARGARSSGPTVSRVLADLESSGAITPSAHTADLAAYVAAKKSLTRLRGTRHTELAAVLANLQAIAASGRLDASRLPALIL